MARKVLLVDSDVDVLGELSAALRSRGFTVLLAGDVEAALERAHSDSPDIILAARALAETEGLLDRLRREPELAKIAHIVLVHDEGAAALPSGYAGIADVDALMALIVSAPPRSVPAEASQGEVRGDLSQVPLIDLLQVLSMNRRTGVLSVTTSAGAGEVRLADGDVLDAVYKRLDGEKAIYRLLGEREGTFAFVPGGAPALRRITVGTSMLVMEAMRQADEVARLRVELAPGGDALIATEPAGEDTARVERAVLVFLQVPRSVDETLDEVQATDIEVLEAMQALSRRGVLRRIPRAALVIQLATSERLQVLRALVPRLAREGFVGPPRIAVAAAPARLATLAGAILRIEDALPPHDPPPQAPVPHLLATLRFGEAVELAVIGIPLVATYSPIWSVALPGTGAVIELDASDCPEFDAACAAAEVPLLHAAALLGEVEEGDPGQVAALIRSALEAAAGG
jgi:CheY-like chemotaxis protein